LELVVGLDVWQSSLTKSNYKQLAEDCNADTAKVEAYARLAAWNYDIIHTATGAAVHQWPGLGQTLPVGRCRCPPFSRFAAQKKIHLRRAARISGACDGRMAVILNMEATPALTIVALGFAVIALGVVYWLLREREDRSVPETKANPTDWCWAFFTAKILSPSKIRRGAWELRYA
jgi:hypothetical protein